MADLLIAASVLAFMLMGLPLMGRLDRFLERVRAQWDKNV